MFTSISIRKAMEKIRDGDWVLPMTQRQYVWGDRANAKQAVIRLFDSLYRNYPIGAFLLWETREPVPFREFVREFDPEADSAAPAEQSQWQRRKLLVYDGQQRLQTLYSCLQYTFAGQVLCFDLFFDRSDRSNSEDRRYGFSFQPANTNLAPSQITVCSLYDEFKNQGEVGLSDYRREKLEPLKRHGAGERELARAEYNIDHLWNLFNKENNQICGYFEMPAGLTAEDVQEIFVRLNTGGVVPSQADLVFSMIHVKHFDFQQQIRHALGEIRDASQIDVRDDDILQLLFYLTYKTTRVDFTRLSRAEDIDGFRKALESSIEPIKAFYKRFLFDDFRINTTSIYRSQLALLPLLLYFCHFQVRDMNKVPLPALKEFFVLSQFNDWSLQALLTSFATLILQSEDFPLDQIKQTVAADTRRRTDLTEQVLANLPNFTLKVLVPKQQYTLIPNRGRLNPEVEHIFPRNPDEPDCPTSYREQSLSLWNLQLGVPGDVNSQKRNKMPRDFFKGKDDILEAHYNFIPTNNLDDAKWDYQHIDEFCRARRALMIEELRRLYGIVIVSQ